MKIKPYHICIVSLWVLSLLSAPLVWTLIPDENLEINLNKGWEEESGESDYLLADFDILGRCDLTPAPFVPEVPTNNFTSYHLGAVGYISNDVVLPPPEHYTL